MTTLVTFQTPKQGSDTVVHVALSDSITSGGHYFDNCQVARPPSAALNIPKCVTLLNDVCKLLNILDFGDSC